MTPQIGDNDIFEGIYLEKFRSLARPYGEFINYERDRSSIDIGLHLTINTEAYTTTNTKVWFQLKGIRRETLPLSDFYESSDVSLDLSLDQLKFWYASPEAIYICVYIECADVFLTEDVRDIVDRQWKESILNPATFQEGQKTVRIRIFTNAILGDRIWKRMLNHTSMRIDSPTFRGRALGHRLDPLRCILDKMNPSLFFEVISKLLSVHGYDIKGYLDVNTLFPSSKSSGDVLSLTYGVVNYTYEWVLQMMTAFGIGRNSNFRTEGELFHVQGPCAVLVHSNKISSPDNQGLQKLARELSQTMDIKHLLVFVNAHNDPTYFGAFFGGVRGTGLQCLPQALGDLAYNLLTTTSVYLDFRDRISWKTINYLY